MELPNLAGVATENLVEKIGGSGFQASYINWSRTVQLLREKAPGWMPELVRNTEGGMLHRAPVGAYLLIRFRHIDGSTTAEVPQAIMDHKNNSVALDKITSRDITDTHRRGVCMAAAFTFGLAYELWAKMPLETGYAAEDKPTQASDPATAGKPLDGVWEAQDEEQKEFLMKVAMTTQDLYDAEGIEAAYDYIESQNFDNEERTALWTQLGSTIRRLLKAENKKRIG